MTLYPNRTINNIITQCTLGCLLVLALLGATTNGAHAAETEVHTPTIIGGELADKDAYPWTVALVKSGSQSMLLRQFCGGALIAPQWVLTAAHCTFSGATERTPESFNAVVGTSTLVDGQGQEVSIAEIIRHENYHRSTATLDIALLRLATPVANPTINLGNAELLSTQAATGTMVLGWGKTDTASRNVRLLQVNVPLVNTVTCARAYAAFSYSINSSMVCAGYAEGGKDACTGDSGGPLVAPTLMGADGTVLQWSLVGIVSWGKGCARANAYGVYANVAHVTDWIQSHTSIVSAMSTSPVNGLSVDTTTIFVPFFQ